MMSLGKGYISQYKLFFDFVATLDHLNVPLLECSVPAIVASLEPSHLKDKTNLVTGRLHWLGGRDLVNVFKFFSAITIARTDATNYLTGELIEKTYKKMVCAEHQSDGEIIREAMMLLVNISNYRLEGVTDYLKTHLVRPRYSTLKTLAAISSRHADQFVKHLPGILERVKVMTELDIDSSLEIVIYDLMQTFSHILLNYLKEREEEERKQFSDCIQLILDVICATCPKDLHQDPRKVLDNLPSMRVPKNKSVEDLVKHKPWPTERPNVFEFHHSVQIYRDISYTIEEGQAAMSYYVQEILTDKDRRQDIVSYLLPLLRSPFPVANVPSTLFFSELLLHPGLLEKTLVKNLMDAMMEKARSSDSIEGSLALKALQNATEGSPGLALACLVKNVDVLYDILQGQRQPIVIIEISKTFSRMTRWMKPKKHQEKLHKMIEFCKGYMNDGDPTLQTHSLELFADLAQRYIEDGSKNFQLHVKSCLSTMFIKLHGEDIHVVAAGTVALFHSLPYIRCQVLRQLLGGDSSGNTRLRSVYKYMGRKQPDLITMMLLQSIKLLGVVENHRAILKHLEMLTDSIYVDELPDRTLIDMCRNLNIMFYPRNPSVKWLINAAMDILSTKWDLVDSLRRFHNKEIAQFRSDACVRCERCKKRTDDVLIRKGLEFPQNFA